MGVHRSGTSAVARLVKLLGTDLGPTEGLLPPDRHNIRGYWEHQDFVRLNEAILERFGGSWQEPPEFHRGWEGSPKLAAHRRKARAMVRQDFQGVPLWGWKDPRNSLTLPFWRKLVPNIRCIISLRNPLDVGSSLQRVHGLSTAKCLDLWLHYTAASLENTSGLPRLFVSYEDLLDDPWGETERIARFLDVPLDRGREFKEEIRSVVEEELWHHRSTVIDALDTPELGIPAKSLYFALRTAMRAEQDRAGRYLESPEFQKSLDILSRSALTEQRRLAAMEAENTTLGEQLKQKEAHLAHTQDVLADKDQHITNVEDALAGTQAALLDRDQHIGNIQDALLGRDQHIANIEDALVTEKDALDETEEQLREVRQQFQVATSTLGYRLLERARAVINRLAPPGTRRRGALKLPRKGLRIILTEGWRTFLRRAVRVWRWGPRMIIRPARFAAQEGSLDQQYQLWLRTHALTSARIRRIRKEAAELSYRPKVSIIMPVYNPDSAWLRDAIESVRAQLYDNWELCIADDASTELAVRALLREYQDDERIKVAHLKEKEGISGASNTALAMAKGEYVGFLDHDDELKPDALYEVVKLLNEQPDLDFIYSDEDKRSPDGRLVQPFFKPDWSPDLLLSVNYVPHFAVYRKRVVDEVGGLRSECDFSQDYDLVLRVTERTNRIGHVALPLYVWRMVPGSAASDLEAKPKSIEAAKRALADAMQRRGVEADILEGSAKTTYRVRYRIQGQPLVSIVIPTRDRLDLLSRCIASIEAKTSYPNYEIIIVDNDSREEATHSYLKRSPHTCLSYPGEFRYGAMMNFGIREAAGEHVILLNNDTEIITPEWIEAMLEHSQRPEVAAVGARLFYPDGHSLQHEGIIMGLGGGSAGNVNHNGYFGLGELVRNCSAVTAACMMVRRDVFERLEGFDERLGVAFNDVDYCLRAREQGYLIVYTPYAVLYHYEGGTRGKLHPMEDEQFFRDRWGNPGEYRDPYYNPNLDLVRPFTIRL